MPCNDPIDQIADDAAADEPEGGLAQSCSSFEMAPAEKKNDQGNDRDQRQQGIVSTEQAPGGAGVVPVNQFEETVHDDYFIRRPKTLSNEQLGKLVEDHHQRGDGGDTTVRRPED